MNTALIILSIAAWLMSSLVSYMLIGIFYHEITELSALIKKMNIRVRNILLRIYVLLGPISLVITLVCALFFVLYLFIWMIWEWLKDIDNERFIDF